METLIFFVSWFTVGMIFFKNKNSVIISFGIGFVLAFFPPIIYNTMLKSTPNTESVANIGVETCVSKGVTYFKEIGSYPTLKSEPNAGRSADEVVRERCNKSPIAFGQ